MPETANESLAVYLAEIERDARIGTSMPSAIVLELIATLRIYMAHTEETNGKVDEMLKALAEV